jgi:DNA-binding response OmpR family regulator
MMERPVLVAEDDELTARLVVETLREAGYRVIRGRDGDEALELARAEQPSLMVLDLNMPGRRGYEVLRLTLQQARPPRVLILTALGRAEVEREMRGLGADDFMSKPFSPAELAHRVGSLLVGDGTRHGKEAPHGVA